MAASRHWKTEPGKGEALKKSVDWDSDLWSEEYQMVPYCTRWASLPHIHPGSLCFCFPERRSSLSPSSCFIFLLGFPMSSSFDRWSPCEGDGLLLAACLIATYSASMSWSVDRSSSCCWVSRLRLVFPVGRCRRLQVSEGRSPGQPHCRRSSPPLLDTFVQKQPNFLFPKLLLFKTCCPPLIVPPSSSSLSNQHTQKNWMFTSLDSP